jgi:hypothetical protein
MRPGRVVGILLVFLTLTVGGVRAQPCDPLPTDFSSTTRYQARAIGPRCEGMFSAPVSGEAGPVAGEQGIALVSLTFGMVSYRLDQDRELVIRLDAPASQATRLRGVGIPLRKYYRLDAAWSPGQRELRLPLSDVIQPERLGSDLIGVFAFRDLPDAKRGFIPVYAAAPGSPVGQDIVALIRPSVEVANVAWRTTAPGLPPTDWTPVSDAAGLVPEGTVLTIPLGQVPPAASTRLDVSYYVHGVERTVPFVLLAP